MVSIRRTCGSDLAGMVNLRALLNVAPVNTTSSFAGAPLNYTNQPKGHATLFADYTLGNWSVDAQWHWFSGGTNIQVFGPGQTFYAQPYYTSFSTTDFTLTKKITFDNGIGHVCLFQRAERLQLRPPIYRRIVRKPRVHLWRHPPRRRRDGPLFHHRHPRQLLAGFEETFPPGPQLRGCGSFFTAAVRGFDEAPTSPIAFAAAWRGNGWRYCGTP